jgi:hypothetical protein
MVESKPSVEELKEEIDDLRRQWDYLDNRGSREEMQHRISGQIERLLKTLKDLYGEEYESKPQP